MDQTSTDCAYSLFLSSSSGARYHNVTTSLVYGPLGIADNLANYDMGSITSIAQLLKGIINMQNQKEQSVETSETNLVSAVEKYIIPPVPGEDYNFEQFVVENIQGIDIDDDAFKSIEAIIHSMTPEERSNPSLLNASRKKRIGKGSGTSVQEVNQLLKQFNQMSKMMKMMQGGGGRKMMQMMKNMPR